MNYEQSVEYLYGLGNEILAMKLGLKNIGVLLEALGNPQENYLKIQIAGTNGKGSTCVFLEAICLEAGIKVGMTTSPHLVSVTERIRLGGAEIDTFEFARHATLVRETSEKLVATGVLETVPTYFEQVTAIALRAFAEHEIELAILETGLGGRFDATTAARAEIVAVTPVDYDHQRILGTTLTEIAAEKAAVIREEARVVIAPQKSEAEQVILERCREKGVEPVLIKEDYIVKKRQPAGDQTHIAVNFATDTDVYHDIVLGLAGRHQIVNALVAVNLAETLRDFGLRIEKEHVWRGLEKARHPGRLENYRGTLLDGAHNAAGARALRAYLDEFVNQPVTMVFGAMRDKDLSEIAEILFPKAAVLILTAPDNPRSMKAEELLEHAPRALDKNKIVGTATVAEALNKALEISAGGNLICVTGSLYLVGEARAILKNSSEI